MKVFFLSLSISISSLLFSQTNKYGFEKYVKENGDKVSSFAIINDGPATITNVTKENLLVKRITKEYIYVTSTANKIVSLYQDKLIKDFFFSSSKPLTMNDSTRATHFVNEVHQGTNGLDASYTGKNVIIGYIDTGCDFQHPDFKDANGNTRIIRYWDHNLPFDAIRTPSEYGYGQIFDSLDINNMIPIPDCTSGHGTTVAGAGSGNGLANGENAGMAPDSKIIIVDFDFSAANVNWTLDVADACDYIFKIADQYGLPAVINISLGQYFGSHDGNDPAAVMMEALVDEKPGRIIVSSAGNAGLFKNYHVQNLVDADTSFFWLNPNPANNIAFFDLWGSLGEVEQISFSFSAVNPATNFETRGQTQYYDVNALTGLINEFIFNSNGDTIARINIYPGIQNGALNLYTEAFIDSGSYYLSFNTTGLGKYEAWTGADYGDVYQFVENIPTAAIYPNIVNYVLPDSLQSVVSDWNCSEKIVTVANVHNRLTYTDINGVFYDDADIFPEHGQISQSSSIGPTRLGMQKPQIAACGDRSFSAAPLCSLTNPALANKILTGGWHGRNSGTSMASPVIAGIAALYLEKCPKATYQDFMDDIEATAIVDNFSGVVPNLAYGFGKAHALNLLLSTDYQVTIDGGDNFCGSPVVLSASSAEALDTYLWDDGSTLANYTINSIGTYTLTATNTKGCKATASKTITMGQPISPSITINPSDTEICGGQTVTFTSSALNQGANPTYQWFVDGINTGITAATYSTSALTNNQIVTCDMVSSDLCATPGSVQSNGITISITPALTPDINITSPNTTICSGELVTFSSTSQNQGTNPSYQWMIDGNPIGTSSPNFSSVSLTDGQVITCVLSSSEQCVTVNNIESNGIAVQVSPISNPSVTINSSDNNICAGTPITFSATGLNGGTSPIYQWYLNNSAVGTNATTYTSSNLQNGDFVFCQFISNNQCASSTEDISNYEVVSVIDNAVIDNQNNSLQCLTAANSYQWYDCETNQLILGPTGSTFIPAWSGSFYAVAILDNCNVSSNCMVVYLADISENQNTNSISVYPNPSKEFVNINNNYSKNYKVRLKSLAGQLINEFNSTDSNFVLNIEHQPNGMYFIEILDGKNNNLTFKIVKN